MRETGTGLVSVAHVDTTVIVTEPQGQSKGVLLFQSGFYSHPVGTPLIRSPINLPGHRYDLDRQRRFRPETCTQIIH